MTQPATMVRIAIHESDHGKRKSLMEDMLKTLQSLNITGVSVLRGIAGLSAKGIIHASDMMHFDVDLPLALEFCADPEPAKAAIAVLVPMVPPGHVTAWAVTRY
jgi:PII-like signaling protein